MKRIGPYHAVHAKLVEFRRNMSDIVLDEAEKDSDTMIEINQDDQLDRGLDSRGRKIRPAYRPFTKSIKKLKGQPTDRVTLYDEGDFYKGFHTERTSSAIYIDSKDKKTEKLVTKYGDAIFGLTKAGIKDFVDRKLRNRMQALFRKSLLG